MEENKKRQFWLNFIVEILGAIFLALGCIGIYFLKNRDFTQLISNIVLLEIGMGAIGVFVRQSRIMQEFDYNNGKHVFRFWIAFMLSMIVAYASVFLPVGGWPFLAVFVVLSLFSNISIGILSGTVLLIMPVLLGNYSIYIFVLYFVSSVFGVVLFHRLDKEFKTGIPLFLSLFGLFLSEIAGIVLNRNARLRMEMFVVPVTNVFVTGIFLMGILRWFAHSVAFRYRLKYLELNDTEYPLLADSREHSRKDYLLAVHTAYFCERIANALLLDHDALKCAAYYHGLREKHSPVEWEALLPPDAYNILKEFWEDGPIKTKENAALYTADAIVWAIIERNREETADYSELVTKVLYVLEAKKKFVHSNLTMHEWNVMQKIFKEEKLYYDFIR